MIDIYSIEIKAKAFTGQEADSLTGLSYYHARYYDPVVGMFLSVDTGENAQGVNAYTYVGENPETATDPTGKKSTCGNNCGGSGTNQNDCNADPTLPGCPSAGNPPPQCSHGYELNGGKCVPDGNWPGDGSSTGSCTGGGGKNTDGSLNCTTRKKPPQLKDFCGAQDCAGQRQAKTIAEQARDHFTSIANALHYISGLWWLDLLSFGIMSVIQAIIGALADIVQVLANGWAWEAKQDLAWFDMGDVDGEALNIGDAEMNLTIQDGAIALGIAGGLAILAGIFSAIPLLQPIGAAMFGLAAGAATAGAIIGLAGVFFNGQSNQYMYQQDTFAPAVGNV